MRWTPFYKATLAKGLSRGYVRSEDGTVKRCEPFAILKTPFIIIIINDNFFIHAWRA